VQNLSLPENLRDDARNLILGGIVPGPKSPHLLTTYLDPIVDSLCELWDGVKATDCRTNQDFNLRAMLLFTSADYPGVRFPSSYWSDRSFHRPFQD